MRLLITTQVLDAEDPVLGFFHEWVGEFAKHVEHIDVVCLREGVHALPPNVAVHSLGKERAKGRLSRSALFIGLSISLKYDAVFVHMNPEYIVLMGWWWRLTGKKIGLWYTHKSVDLKLRTAELFANIIFTASKESFRLSSRKVRVAGHGIDTDFWTPDPSVERRQDWLSVGRLMPSKRHDRAIRLAREKGAPLRIAGGGPEQERLEALARELGADVAFLGPCTRETLRDEYRRAARLVHRSETGSLDKVVLEAAACGCAVDSTDPAISALPLSPEYVRTHHSLQSLIPRIIQAYDA
ncbi:MAG TPA: glycosyltransferase [Candidatus Paceibacterota bacterium]|nr:glycosyltransferase [Candidatus Paceibacterota bacterium]